VVVSCLIVSPRNSSIVWLRVEIVKAKAACVSNFQHDVNADTKGFFCDVELGSEIMFANRPRESTKLLLTSFHKQHMSDTRKRTIERLTTIYVLVTARHQRIWVITEPNIKESKAFAEREWIAIKKRRAASTVISRLLVGHVHHNTMTPTSSANMMCTVPMPLDQSRHYARQSNRSLQPNSLLGFVAPQFNHPSNDVLVDMSTIHTDRQKRLYQLEIFDASLLPATVVNENLGSDDRFDRRLKLLSVLQAALAILDDAESDFENI
jgi:hypothetical protein